jgi:uncharacterized protein (DUF305 family)
MNRLLLSVGVGVVLAAGTASCGADRAGQPADQSTPQIVVPGKPGEESRVVQQAPRAAAGKATPADVKFMQGMIHHHAQALEMTALLRARTSRADMKLLAERIDVSQADEIKMMRAWLAARGEAAPAEHAHGAPSGATPDAVMMPGMLTKAQMDALAAAKGAAFDRLFLEGMIQHHGGALIMVQELLAAPGAAQDGEIFDFVSHVDSDQRMEINRMRSMLKGI